MDALVVRRLAPDEWEVYRTVRLAALQESPSAFWATYEGEVDLPEQEWRRRLADGLVLVAYVDGEPAGTAAAFTPADRPDEALLVGTWVRPADRGLGIGDALVEGALAWADRAGCGSVGLWVVRGNEAARRLYLRHGFEPTTLTQPLPHDPCQHEERMLRRL